MRFRRRPGAQLELLDERQDLAAGHRQRGQLVDGDLDVEVARVGEHRAVLHALEVLAREHLAPAGHGDEDVAARRGVAAPA